MKHYLMVCTAVILTWGSHATLGGNVGTNDPKIQDVLNNVYSVSLKKGKRVLRIIGKNTATVYENKWWTSGDGRKCEKNIARLATYNAAIRIEGTDYIVAFLECPAARDFSTGTLVALFMRNDTSTSVCSAYIDLSKDESSYYWGGVSYLAAYKKSKGNGFYLVSIMEGGDGGGSWKSIDIFSFTPSCDLKLISRAYASQYHSTENTKDCSGERIEYAINDNDTATIYRTKISCRTGKEVSSSAKTKQIIPLIRGSNTTKH